MRAYLQQRDHIADLNAQIAETGQDIEALEREKQRWQDDAYVEMQARERFGYVMPGETGYQVIDENGEPLDSPDQLSDPDSVEGIEPTPWWETAWASVEAAGDPEDPADRPEQKIQAPAP
ncbi:septum formation initiator family protein [Nocardioides sp. MJB4]|uniref:Septum formation initiator family protein n=2 Tax=Nocardioides donggukensis TaxID=2774019 RepID=A0A927Q2J8_9ACTN|nr:septum formation initiator family protein [Nocardioides donggukensis]